MSKELSKCRNEKVERVDRMEKKNSSSSQNKENTMTNLSATNKKVLDLLKSELKRKTDVKVSSSKTRRI